MKKTLSKMVSLALVLMLAASLFTALPALAEDPFTPFEKEVHLKIPVYDRGVEGVPTISENYWTHWVQENFGDKYNIKVEYVPITRTDVMTDYALMAAGQTLPTVLMEYDYPKVAQWANDGYLTTYDLEEFAKVAPTYYQSMVKNNQLGYTQMNGETYFAFAERPYWDTGYAWQTVVRMDWLRQVGYDYVPTIYSEFIDAMDKIVAAGLSKHPLGGAMITGVGSDQNYAFRNFPEDETEWAMYSSVTISALGWEPAYKLLKRLNLEYNKGLANPEYYITESEANKAAFINGETYRFGDYMAANKDWLDAFYAQNPDAELVLEPIITAVDEAGGTTPAYRADNPFGMIVCFSSMASKEEILAAWMYMEWLSQPENLFTFQWGIEGENYILNAQTGIPESVGGYEGEAKQGYNNSKDYWCIVREGRSAGTIEQIIASISPQGLPKDFTQEIIDNYYRRVETAEAGYASSDPIFSMPIDAEVEYAAELQPLYKEYRDKLTMCTPEEFDALYAELTQKYLDAGYQAVIDGRKEAYEAGASTKLRIAK